MADITLKVSNEIDKYGIVTVLNEDNTINRQYRITKEELSNLHNSGNGIPPNCTREEWVSGRAFVRGMCVDVGEVFEKDGYIVIKFAEEQVGDHLVESVVSFAPGEWSGTLPEVTIASDKLATNKYHQGKLASNISEGEVTY